MAERFNQALSTPNPPAQAIVANFKGFYADLVNIPLEDIDQIYAQNTVFKDPVHQMNDIAQLHTYMSELCKNLSSGRFEYLDQLVGDGVAYIKWNMHFVHPKLGDETIVVRGMSHIEFNDRITYHEDVYDIGEMLYEHLPVIGKVTQFFKRRLANAVNG